jgi:MFS superfamily sulfate permease-like transporter
MFLHIKDFQRFYSKSKVDGILWMGTFLCVLLTSADIGLGIGIILTVFVMAYRNYQVTITPLDIRDEQVVCDDSISGSNDDSLAKIQTLRLSGTLSFANCDSIISRCKSLFYLTEEEMSAYVSSY